jgi:hypothetical protein
MVLCTAVAIAQGNPAAHPKSCQYFSVGWQAREAGHTRALCPLTKGRPRPHLCGLSSQLAAGGRARAHVAYWLGLQLHGALPQLGRGPHTEAVPPPQMCPLGTSLLDIFALPSINVSNLAAATAKNLDLTDAPLP